MNTDNTQSTVKFYHETGCTRCTNTHRTDFVGYEHANRFFNIISPKVRFPDGCAYKIHDDMHRLKDLAEKLMQKQGVNLFLNEYPEECDHRQFIDLDANVPDDVLERIIFSQQELTTGGEIQVLRNTSSGKVHLIMDTPAYTARHSLRKKAIAVWLCTYLYDAADLSQDYSPEQWHDDIFDLQAAGIRSAFSVKVKDGKLESSGVYAPPGVDPTARTINEKVRIFAEYSIYAPARGNWTEEAVAAFEVTETQLLAQREACAEKYKIVSEYDPEKKSIEFLGQKREVSGKLINEFIRLVPKLWNGKRHWGIMLKYVKCAASLVNNFDPAYFLHKWSARNKDLYNETGNNDQYARCQIDPECAGESLTWLRNMATKGYTPDPNLARGDMGLAEIFAAKVGNNIKIVGDDVSSSGNTCYLWDNTSRLWIHRNNKWIGNEVSKHLECTINRYA